MPLRPKLRPRLVGLALVALLATSAASSCVIADPTIDLPSLPQRRPLIVRDQVVPSSSAVLGYFPSEFSLAVEIDRSDDPLAQIEARLFFDYDALSQDRASAAFVGKRIVTIGKTSAGVRAVTLGTEFLPSSPNANECHVIEAIVAFSFAGNPPDGLLAHTPGPGGGDSVVWFYSPSGDLSGCPHVDGGLDGATPDASDGRVP